MRRRGKRVLLAAAVAATLAALGAGVWLAVAFYPLINNPFNDREFDQGVWLESAGSDDADNPRGAMAYDVRRIVMKNGLNKEQVLSLLGEPDFAREQQVFKYNLGAWSGFGIDYDSLDVHFGTDGKAVEVLIVQH